MLRKIPDKKGRIARISVLRAPRIDRQTFFLTSGKIRYQSGGE